MFRKFLMATAALALMTGQATAGAIGIGDSVSGTSATIYLSTHTSFAGLEGGITLMGPGQGGGTDYAFDFDYPGGAEPAGFTGYDAVHTVTPPKDWQSVTIVGLADGLYEYLFTEDFGGQVTAAYLPWTEDYADFTGSFRIEDGGVNNVKSQPKTPDFA
ncbi:MAG: hypothetical protein JKX94_02230 [Sneathiella sp.]|nr:hypothetical protein [Sneathiella sp.]